jgi:hypothetical protein
VKGCQKITGGIPSSGIDPRCRSILKIHCFVLDGLEFKYQVVMAVYSYSNYAGSQRSLSDFTPEMSTTY